jgi:peroxiredoxin
MPESWGWWLVVIAAVAVVAILYFRRGARPVPDSLRRGQPLPAFNAVDEQGNVVNSGQLKGTAVVMIFVRGNWCPFCSKQVKNLTGYYKAINDLGAKLIFVTPKPLETTRRVAEFFKVEFDFWLDESLEATRALGLLLGNGVPRNYIREYGSDTIWPTSIVIDPQGTIRFVELSKHIIDRPNPKTLLRELRKAIGQ